MKNEDGTNRIATLNNEDILTGGRSNQMKAYVNYPNPHMTLHGNLNCLEIGKMQKPQQRVMTINRASFAQAINQLSSINFQLGAQAQVNDVWLSIEFGDSEFEEAVARYACRLLRERYSPLKVAPIKKHC